MQEYSLHNENTMKPVFKNRKNQPIEVPNGETIWNSRSCAVVAQVCGLILPERRWYILLGKRGSGTPDFQGFWGLPCGYLDWDETLCEAVIREVWEECGLHLPKLSSHPDFVHSTSSITRDGEFTDTPWAVTDRVDNVKQNISMHYFIPFVWQSKELPSLSADNSDPNEVDALAWVPIVEAMEMDLAFNHQQRIRLLWNEQNAIFRQIESHTV